jgi:hypothetical protein
LKIEEESFAETPVTLSDMESYPKYAFEIDKSTYFAGLSQLLVFVAEY